MEEKTFKLTEFKKKEETFTYHTQCLNCGHQYSASLPKGTLVAESYKPCPNCEVSASVVEEYFKKHR